MRRSLSLHGPEANKNPRGGLGESQTRINPAQAALMASSDGIMTAAPPREIVGRKKRQRHAPVTWSVTMTGLNESSILMRCSEDWVHPDRSCLGRSSDRFGYFFNLPTVLTVVSWCRDASF